MNDTESSVAWLGSHDYAARVALAADIASGALGDDSYDQFGEDF